MMLIRHTKVLFHEQLCKQHTFILHTAIYRLSAFYLEKKGFKGIITRGQF